MFQSSLLPLQAKGDIRRKFLKAAAVAYIPALLYTLICRIVSLVSFESHWKITYGQAHSGLCILNNQPPLSMIVGINGPACLLLLTSVVNFIVTLAFILKSVGASKAVRNKQVGEKLLLRTSLKLGLLLGLAWVLPMLAIWLNSPVLGAIGNVLLSTQGFLLALSLLMRGNVKVLVRGSFRTKTDTVAAS